MASRYVKIPVYQVLNKDNSSGEETYPVQSTIMKTLRVPQEYLMTMTGSGYIRSTVEGEVEEIEGLQKITHTQLDGALGEDQNQNGMWFQIPLNTEKNTFHTTSGEDSYNTENHSVALWLRVSQEVVYEDPTDGTTTAYIMPQVVNWGIGQGCQQEVITDRDGLDPNDPEKMTYQVGNIDAEGTVNYLQNKIIECLAANPGAQETLLDFGTVDNSNTINGKLVGKTDASGTYPTNTGPDGIVGDAVRGKCRLLVTCAAVTNSFENPQRNPGTDLLDPSSYDPAEALGEVWGATVQYGTTAGINDNAGAGKGRAPQIQFLNAYGSTNPGTISYSLGIGNVNIASVAASVCEFYSKSSGKKPGGGAMMG
tara:strand:- start:1745 stop:2845 length:1101 start_codon:yes stop_codon:yes gene_type:complete